MANTTIFGASSHGASNYTVTPGGGLPGYGVDMAGHIHTMYDGTRYSADMYMPPERPSASVIVPMPKWSITNPLSGKPPTQLPPGTYEVALSSNLPELSGGAKLEIQAAGEFTKWRIPALGIDWQRAKYTDAYGSRYSLDFSGHVAGLLTLKRDGPQGHSYQLPAALQQRIDIPGDIKIKIEPTLGRMNVKVSVESGAAWKGNAGSWTLFSGEYSPTRAQTPPSP